MMGKTDDSRAGGRHEALLVVLAVSLAALLRWRALELGPSSDEVANVDVRGFWAIWADAETGVNPPLLRWCINLAPAGWEVGLGRAISYVAGLVEVALGTWLALRIGGVMAPMAALLLAVHAHLIPHGSEARAYGLLGCCLLGQAAALDAAVREDRPWRWAWLGALVVAGLWLHYLAWPVTAGLVVSALLVAGWRRAAMLSGAIAVAAAPLIPRLVEPSRLRRPPLEPWTGLGDKLLSFDLMVPPRIIDLVWHSPAGRVSQAEPLSIALAVGLVVASLVGRLLGWRQRGVLERTLLLQWLALVLGALWIGTFQNVRPPVIGLSVMLAAPWLLAARSRGPALVLALVVALWIPAAALDLWRRTPVLPPYGAWADALRTEIEARENPPAVVRIRPGWLTAVFAYTLTGRTFTGGVDRRGCPDGTSCFALGSTRFIGDDHGDGAGWVLVEDERELREEERSCQGATGILAGRLRLCP